MPKRSASARGRKRSSSGLLGSDVLGFHTQFHCNNFMETVDRFLESRIDRVARLGNAWADTRRSVQALPDFDRNGRRLRCLPTKSRLRERRARGARYGLKSQRGHMSWRRGWSGLTIRRVSSTGCAELMNSFYPSPRVGRQVHFSSLGRRSHARPSSRAYPSI